LAADLLSIKLWQGKAKAKEKLSALANNQTAYGSILFTVANQSPAGLQIFAFRRPCPVKCEAYLSGVSGKQKKRISLRALRLCGESKSIGENIAIPSLKRFDILNNRGAKNETNTDRGWI
jgi:hypothetical protein